LFMAKVFLHFPFYSMAVCCCAVALCHDYDCISSCHYYLLFFASTLPLQRSHLSYFFFLGFNLLLANPFKVEFNASGPLG